MWHPCYLQRSQSRRAHSSARTYSNGGFVRRSKGRRIKNLTKLQNGNVQITIINNVTNNLNINVGSVNVAPAETIIEFDRKIPIAAEVLTVYRDETSLRRLEGVFRPLLKEGIDVLDVQSGDVVVETVTKEDARSAVGNRGVAESAHPSEPPVVDSTYELALEIIKIPFKGDNLVWSMSNGDQKMNVEMADHAFLEKHQAGLTVFSAGDVLRVRIHTTSWRTPKGLMTKSEVLEVLEHIHSRPEQASIFDQDSTT
jgi:hypothetical protein